MVGERIEKLMRSFKDESEEEDEEHLLKQLQEDVHVELRGTGGCCGTARAMERVRKKRRKDD